MAEDTAQAGAESKTDTFTQADVDRIVSDRVARERKRFEGVDLDDLRTKAQKLADLEASQQSEAEKLIAERDNFKTAAETAAAENLRYRIALEKQIPAELMDRLRGNTKEEMEADADKLLELVRPTPGLDGGAREPVNETNMDSVIRNRARGTRV